MYELIWRSNPGPLIPKVRIMPLYRPTSLYLKNGNNFVCLTNPFNTEHLYVQYCISWLGNVMAKNL